MVISDEFRMASATSLFHPFLQEFFDFPFWMLQFSNVGRGAFNSGMVTDVYLMLAKIMHYGQKLLERYNK